MAKLDMEKHSGLDAESIGIVKAVKLVMRQ
jgi:hypothetical protein